MQPQQPAGTDHEGTSDDDPSSRHEIARCDAALAREEGDWDALEGVYRNFPELRDELEAFRLQEERLGVNRMPPRDPLAEVPVVRDFADRYETLRLLGTGTYGRVHLARERMLGRTLAVKFFRGSLQDRRAVLRFLEEPQIAGQLDHPGIPAVHAVGRTPDGRPFVAMRLISGERTLRAVMDAGGDATKLLSLFAQACRVVAYAHSRGVVHRDLKPANVMVGRFDEVQVIDWGMAKVLLSHPEPLHTLRVRPDNAEAMRTAGGLGTPAYMAPEQADARPVTPAADVFALGAMLCEILVGRAFWAADGTPATLYGDATAATSLLARGRAFPALAHLAATCLSATEGDRPAASAVADGIDAHLAGLQSRVARLRLWVAAAVTVAATAVAGAALVVVQSYRSMEAERAEARYRESGGLLDDAEAALRAGKVEQAEAALARAGGRLSGEGDAGQRERYESLKRCAAFVRECDDVRQGGHTGDEVNYASPLRRLGLEIPDPTPEAEAEFFSRAKALPVAWAVLAALDDQYNGEAFAGERRRLLRLARGLGGVDEWSRRFRSEDVRQNKDALVELSRETSPADRSPAELEVLALALVRAGRSPSDLLRRGLAAHPADFRLHLAAASLPGRDALSHARTAQAMQPLSVPARVLLTRALLGENLAAEAVGHARAVVARRPDVSAYVLLVQALRASGDGRAAEAAEAEATERFGGAFAGRLRNSTTVPRR